MTVGTWLALSGVWIAVLALPGPDIFLILRLGVRERKPAFLAAFGIMTGNTVWITVSVIGISALLNTYPFILPAIQLFGVVVLGYLGFSSVKDGIKQLRTKTTKTATAKKQKPWLLGLITNLANPKALIFFTAILGQFVPPGSSWVASLSIIIFMILIGLGWFLGLAFISSGSAFRIWFRDAAPWFDVVAGGVFVVVSAMILYEVVAPLLNFV